MTYWKAASNKNVNCKRQNWMSWLPDLFWHLTVQNW